MTTSIQTATTCSHIPSRAGLARPKLLADIGGTNARFALADPATLELSHVGQIRCSAEPSFAAALSGYLASLPRGKARGAAARSVTGMSGLPSAGGIAILAR